MARTSTREPPPGLLPAIALLGLLLGVAVLWPLRSGHAWLLDWVPGEHGPLLPRSFFGLDGGLTSGVPLDLVASALSKVLGDAAGVLPFVAFFPIAALGAARLAGQQRTTAIPAALFFTLNPFVFDRLYAGQIGVLLGYALLPFAVKASLEGPDATGITRFRAAAWWAAAALLSVHFLWIVGIPALAVVIQHRARMKSLAWLAISMTTVGLLSAYLFFAQLGQGRPVSVTAVDLASYRTQKDPHLGLYGNVLGLYGFWRIGPRLPKQDLPIWPFLLTVLLIVIVVGAVAGARDSDRRPLTVVLLISGALGFFLALGDQGPTGSIFRAMYDHLPLFDVMREPEKFSSLLALAYAVLFGWGVEAIVCSVDGRRVKALVAIVVILLPIDYVPTIFDGLNGQIRASHVPASYQQANALMGKGSGQILALPWHQYLSFPFTGRVIANPIPTLFDRSVIAGDDVELPGVPTTSTSTRSAYLEFLYAHGSDTHEFGSLIAPLGISFVLLSKTVDFTSYGWLGQQRDLTRVLDTPDLTVYRNDEPVDQGHRVSATITVADWGQLLALADRVDLARAAVVVQHADAGPITLPTVIPQLPTASATPVSRPSAVRATVPAGPAGWVTLAEPFAAGWRLQGKPPVPLAQGGMAFQVGPDPAGITFPHWRVTLFGYCLSVGAAAALFGGLVRQRLRWHRRLIATT